jgi:hypothetical protein
LQRKSRADKSFKCSSFSSDEITAEDTNKRSKVRNSKSRRRRKREREKRAREREREKERERERERDGVGKRREILFLPQLFHIKLVS